jgi:ketosteroid isomerase-like protein
MTERDPELQNLIDEAAIRRLLANYPRAIDRQDFTLLASLFHPDAIADYGVYNGSASGFVEWERVVSKPGVHWTHHYGTQIIDIEGAIAQAETYCIALCRQGAPGEAGYEQEIFLRVRYLDRVEKRSGEWRIAHRRVVFAPCYIADAAEPFPLPSETFLDAGYPDDRVYKR